MRYRRKRIHKVSFLLRHVLTLYDQSYLQALHLVAHFSTLVALDFVMEPAPYDTSVARQLASPALAQTLSLEQSIHLDPLLTFPYRR